MSDAVIEHDASQYPFRVEVTKNTKGYNYSIRVSGEDTEYIQNKIKELHEWAEENFGPKE